MAFALSNLPAAGVSVQEKFSLSWLGLIIITGILVCVISGIARLLRPHTDSTRRSIFRAAGFWGVVLAGTFVFLTVFGTRQTNTEPSSNAAQYDVSNFNDSSFTPRESHFTTTPSAFTGKPEAGGTVPVDEDTLWLPITQDTLNRLANDEQAREIRELLAKIPQELSQAYAMIPLTQSGPGAGSPVIRQVLSPTAIRYLLTPGRLQTISAAVTAMLPPNAEVTEEGDTVNVELETPIVETETSKIADWVDQKPGIGQTVVSSKFIDIELMTSAEEALRPAIVEALQNRITKLCSREFGIDERWTQLVDVSISDRCVRQCIVKTDRMFEVLDTVDGSKKMQQTYALIEFPEAVEQQALGVIRKELIKSRTIAVCITLIAVWLCGLLLTFAFQASQHGSFLRKLATVPAMAILVVPCLVVAMAMISSMASGDSFELNWGKGRVSYVVDTSSD